MKLEVRNLQSQETFSIVPEGMIFGREGGPADIRVADQSVSKRHAKVYQREGTWWLEDLKSVNGTVVNSKRITEPVPLTPGFVFALSKHKFEVLRIEDELGTAASLSRDSGNGRSDPQVSQPKRGRQPPPQPIQEDYEPPVPQGRSGASSGASQGASAGPEPKGIGYFFVAVPKAIAYYMAAIPLMALNPVGTIRKGPDNLRFMPMGRMELIAYALPALFFSALVGTLGAVLATIITGGLSGIVPAIVGAITGIISGAIGAIIGAAIVGYFGDRIIEWIIRKILKGQSDARGRTNYLISAYVFMCLARLPALLTIVFVAVVARLASLVGGWITILNVLPALLTAVVSVAGIYFSWVWAKHFAVAKWVFLVLKILGVLALLGGLFGVFGAVMSAISSFGSGGSSSSGSIDAAAEEALKAQEKALEELRKSGDKDAIKAAEEAMATARKAAEDAKAAAKDAKIADAVKAEAEAQEKALAAKGEEVKDKVEDAKDKVDDKEAKAAADKAEKEAKAIADKAEKEAKAAADKAEKEAKAAADKAEKEAKAAAAATVKEDDAPAPKSGDYGAYADKKAAIEKAIEADPTVLLKQANEESYAKLLKCLREADARPDRKKDYEAVLEPLYKRKTEAKQFQNCAGLVDKLHRSLKL